MLYGPECDAGARLASSGRPTGPVDVGLDILRRLDLDNEVHVWNIEPSRRDVGSHEDAELVFLESVKSHLSLALRNVSVHDFDILIDFIGENQGVGFRLRRREDNRLPKAAIDDQQVRQSFLPVVIGTTYRNVVDILLRLVFEILRQIDHLPVWPEVVVGQVLDPGWNSGGEEEELRRSLRALLDLLENLIYVLFEAHVQHLVGLVEDQCLQLREISKVTSIQMIQYSSSRSNEDVDALSQSMCLIVDGGAAVDCDDGILIVMVFQL